MIKSETDTHGIIHYMEKDVSEYIYFHNTPEQNKPKTEVWDVLTKSGNDLLGIIKYYANWRQYCFFPAGNPVFSTGCMNDIVSFTKDLTKNKRLAPTQSS